VYIRAECASQMWPREYVAGADEGRKLIVW
jgi:hypothetical protein